MKKVITEKKVKESKAIIETEQVISVEYDCKNREVLLKKITNGKTVKYEISKADVGKTETAKSIDKAELIFNNFISDSQNQ